MKKNKATKNTILYGNGLNYHYSTAGVALSWSELLNQIMGSQKFETGFMPFTIVYERIRLNWNLKKKIDNLPHIKEKIATLLANHPSNPYFNAILNMDCNNYLTTNYDYAINNTFLELDSNNHQVNLSTEELYSIRRKTQLISRKNLKKNIWNIHGELDSPKSIVLGYNHYSGTISKIDSYLKGTYDFRYKGQKKPILKIEEKIAKNRFDEYSWIELFFNSHVHIIGLTLEFSEIDLWRILTKRARLYEVGLIKNEITYYTKPTKEIELRISKEKNPQKKSDMITNLEFVKRKLETLRSFKVNVKEVKLENDYSKHWNSIFKHIKSSS